MRNAGRHASRRAQLVSALLVTAALLAGCGSLSASFTAQVPTSGPIEQGEQVGVDPEDQFIRVIAREPRPGMTADEIVTGFLDASASFDGNHAVARTYLTPEASRTWDTNAGVTVYEGLPTLASMGTAVSFRALHAGSIASSGRYSVASPGSEVRTSFFLERVEGEWRISRVPEGLLLSQADVDRAFRSFNVYYFNPTFTMLVPDPRMVPVIGPGLATTLVRRLITGPTQWLQPAVRTGIPPGVDLNIDAVPIEAGVARVDLTANALDADDQTRRALSQQLVWTLRQLPDVQAVEITAAGQLFSVPGVATPQPRDSWPAVDPNLMPVGSRGYATRPEGVVALDPQGVESVPGGAGLGEVVLIDIAVAPDSLSLAGIDTEGLVWRARLADDATMIRLRDEGVATSLAFDGSSSVWVVDETEGLLSVTAGGTSRAVKVDGLTGRAELRSVIPSRDGTRAALIVRRGPRTELLLARVIRSSVSASGISLEAPVRVESRLAEVVDVAWSSADTLSVLGSESAGSLQVFDVDLARGSITPNGAPEAPVSVGAAPGLPTLVGAADGLVYELGAGSWAERVRGSAPTYPG
ncbi:MAG TPA: hypothetical protein DCQ36_08035, partial [Actinobacteria bacterium]|jgi:Lipoprotein LpqB beta-propeller domain/Sporulation and spore germination|nr:hypothetical protein [Actinomycetota bacterium]